MNPPGAPARLVSVDLVRGLAMVLMALDHVRDFLYFDPKIDPVDLEQSPPALFLTRWITHFCAPAFLLLAGVGASLAIQRGKSKADQSFFLLTRGVWLIFLELLVLRTIGWFWNVDFSYLPAWVIWTLGWSMILLAGLLWLPTSWVGAFGLASIVSHHLLDGIQAETFGAWQGLWVVLHDPSPVIVAGRVEWAVGYPLIPWSGVMAAGYAVGGSYAWEARQRRRLLIGLGVVSLLAFVTLRWANGYGEKEPWRPGADGLMTVLSFVNCTKQPPSLDFLLMTLGPTFLLLAATESAGGPPARFFITFGRTPLFFYLLHLPLIHALACGVCLWQQGHLQPWIFSNPKGFWERPGFGVGLGGVYLAWALVVALLYPPCAWYASFKAHHRWAALSYL